MKLIDTYKQIVNEDKGCPAATQDIDLNLKNRNKAFKETHAKEAEEGLARLKQVAREGGNLFEVMMEIVEYCTVGQVTQALFETGGKFRRNM